MHDVGLKPSHWQYIMKIIRRVTLALVTLTALAVTHAHAQEPFRRDLEQTSFIPKGQWITGVSVSYTQSSQSNYQFLVLEGINGNAYSFKVSPMLLYSFQDNLAAGGRFAYKRTFTRLNSADIKLSSEDSFEIDNLYSLSHTYYATAVFRNYISFGSNKRFGMFNEVQLEYGGGQSKLCNGSGEDLTGTFSTTHSLNVGLAPGMIVFLNNYSALEVNVGVLGFEYSSTKSKRDQIYVSSYDHKSANFKINLFSITFGIAFYL